MAKNNNNNKSQKVKRTYHLVIYDEKTLDQIFNFKLSKVNLFTYIGLIFIIITALVVVLLVFTPLNVLLPKYEDLHLRAQAIQNRILIDSLKHEIKIRDEYFHKIRTIIVGKDLSQLKEIDTSASQNYLSQAEHDSLLERLSQANSDFIKNFSLGEESNSVVNLHFYKPVNGIVINKFDPAQGHFGIDLTTKKDEVVVSVLPGTVIYSRWDPSNGYVVIIQHPNNFLSVYKHNQEVFKKEGDHVEAGEPIAVAGNTGENTTGPHLHFELWYNGQPVNPEDYIIF